MTSAQKLAKEKFKKAIAYRQKSGVSLKEAFAHVYGKKKVAKKVVRKKVAKKRIAGPKDSAAVKRELARKGLKMPHGYTTTKRKRKISGVKKKKITEKGILNKIHIVKRNVDKLDEAQHKHMMGGKKHFTHSLLDELNSTLNKLNNAQIYKDRYESALKYKKVPKDKIQIYKNEIKKIKEYIKELKTHFTQIKKNYKPI
jgi:hypothetical protein